MIKPLQVGSLMDKQPLVDLSMFNSLAMVLF